MQLEKGLNEQIIEKISSLKKEPKWMLEIRLNAYKSFKNLENPKWGPNLSNINFDDVIYYSSPSNEWEEIPNDVKETFKKLNIPTLEAKIISGINEQYDSSSIYHEIEEELKSKNVIFCSMDDAILQHEDLVKEYFSKLVPIIDNKYAALNTAVWSGGSFLYIPKGVKIEKPLQAYFRINSKSVGQFERTLIIVEEDSEAHYIEGCTAPVYDKNNLHAAVVEIFIKKSSKLRYSTIQNWSKNVINLVTKRAIVEENSQMEWIDGNLGSGLNMKYPATILKGNNSVGRCISIAVSSNEMIQDTGAKFIHVGKNTKSQIISKCIAMNGGESSYRGLVKILENAENSFSEIKCDSIIMDGISCSNTCPREIIQNKSSFIKHEAKVTQLDKEKIFYLNSKKIDNKEAEHLLILGFIDTFTKELPLEYAVELNRLLKNI